VHSDGTAATDDEVARGKQSAKQRGALTPPTTEPNADVVPEHKKTKPRKPGVPEKVLSVGSYCCDTDTSNADHWVDVDEEPNGRRAAGECQFAQDNCYLFDCFEL